jgi:hypothetical protein
MNFKEYNLTEASKLPLFIVDIQPEYEKNMGFKIHEFCSWLNKNASKYSNVVLFWNGPELGMSDLHDIQMWYLENGLKESVLQNITWQDKAYAFFRYCMDSGIDEDDIVKLVQFMKSHDINDSRELEDKNLWDEWIAQNGSKDVRELMEFSGDCLTIPDLMDQIKGYGKKVYVLGGGQDECLKEIEIAMKANGQEPERISQWVYEEEKITELQIDNSNSDLGDNYAEKNPTNNEEEYFRNHYKLIGKNPIKDCEMHSYLDGKSMFIFLVDKDNNPVARYDMYINNYANLGNILTEHTTLVDKKHQGKGYTSEVYSYLINKFGALVSDQNHTEGMKKTWQKLATKFKPSHIEEFSDKRGQPVWKETELSRVPDTVYDADRELFLLLRK